MQMCLGGKVFLTGILKEKLVRRFAVQILLALKHLHDQRIVHADLKPENILLANRTTSCIKIIDFGSSCFVAERGLSYSAFSLFAPYVCLQSREHFTAWMDHFMCICTFF